MYQSALSNFEFVYSDPSLNRRSLYVPVSYYTVRDIRNEILLMRPVFVEKLMLGECNLEKPAVGITCICYQCTSRIRCQPMRCCSLSTCCNHLSMQQCR